MDKRAFGQALIRERERHGMTADGFAHALGLTAEEYAAYERGDTLPSLELAQTFAQALGVPLDTLTAHSYVPPLRMGKEDGTTREEKERIERELENAAIDRYNRGRRWMLAIIIVEAVFCGIDLLASGLFNLAALIASGLEIAMIVCLWRGKTWARYIFVGLNIIGILLNLLTLGSTDGEMLLIVIGVVVIAWQVITCVLLCANKSVEEFLYEQSTLY